MALIDWTPQLSLNITDVDRQHKKLVDIINELDRAMQDGRGRDVVGDILDRLVDYTVYHFGAEEHLLEEHCYPGSARHKLQHAEFIRKLIDFKTGYLDRQLGLSINVMTFLSDWLVEHIMGTDRQYGPHLVARGVV